MARYFFNVRNGFGFIEDEEGAEFPSVAEAAANAVRGARSLLSAEVTAGQLDLRGRIEVADEGGQPILTVPFVEVVEIKTGLLPGVGTAEHS